MAKHEKTFVDFDKPYEQNIVGMKGIIIFLVGLAILIIITFGLMWFLMNFMYDNHVAENERNRNPMQVTAKEALPPEPRLQAAPGFGVQGKDGWVNLELKAPQSEYWELEKIWKDKLENGVKDEKTGVVLSLPINEAKEKLLQQNIKAKPLENGRDPLAESRMYYSESSAGRMETLKRR